ncbi:lipopolysaccharide transport periplasmic protein LptA [Glaesserella parasuis]|nr:lipopolysaccharide transport periplasmic protein LptA [Glaesserella parasuis]
MNFRTKLVLIIALCLVNLSVKALETDRNMPIKIDSGSQSLDMERNIVTFSDNVVVTQGSIKLNAEKVTIIRRDTQKELIEAFGTPVVFQQTLHNEKIVTGTANSVHYDLDSEFLILRGNAELKQLDSAIKAEKITYDVKKQNLKATSNDRQRVKTVLIPNQLQSDKK